MSTYDGDLRELYTDEDLSPTTAVYIHCPMHVDKRRPSMRVYSDGAKCFTCGAYLSRRSLLEKAEPERITAAKTGSSGRSTKAARPELRVEEIRVLARMAHQNMSFDAMGYFEGRGLRPETITRYMLGHYGYGFTVPVFNSEDGEVLTVKFRRDDYIADQDTPKYWGLRGHNEPRVYPWPVTLEEPTIVLVEGEFDALVLRQTGIPAYTLTSGAASWSKISQATFPAGTHVILLYDNDEAGREALAHLPGHLERMGYTSSLVTLPSTAKDVSAMAMEEPEAFERFTTTMRNTLWTPNRTPLSTPPSVVSPS